MKSISVATIFGFATAFGLLSQPSQASDSLWLLCDNGKLAMNLLEHRSADGRGRVTSLSLILGINTFSGRLTNANSGKVFLIGTPKDQNNFKGNIAVDYLKKVVSLKGTLNLTGDRFKIDTQLKCKEMRWNL